MGSPKGLARSQSIVWTNPFPGPILNHERLHCCYIYICTAPTCTISIITLKPCALNAEFQHFIPRFNKISILCGYRWKRG
jgi:hypothetical protein